ncbi:hypothetical protein ACFLXG_03955 [Chloroflexota bacterium]
MRQGDKVRVLTGEYQGKTGVILCTVPVGGGARPAMPMLCIVRFFDDGKEAQLQANQLVLIAG